MSDEIMVMLGYCVFLLICGFSMLYDERRRRRKMKAVLLALALSGFRVREEHAGEQN